MAGEGSGPINEHRLTEFIYGTVTGMVALAGVDAASGLGALRAMLIVMSGAVVIWLAHVYAALMSHRIASAEHLDARDILKAAWSAWPILSAGALMSLPLLGTAFGLYGLATGLKAASGVGLLILATVGLAAGFATRERWGRRLAWAVAAAALGVLVVGLELAVHH